jgi:hypothetical protein
VTSQHPQKCQNVFFCQLDQLPFYSQQNPCDSLLNFLFFPTKLLSSQITIAQICPFSMLVASLPGAQRCIVYRQGNINIITHRSQTPQYFDRYTLSSIQIHLHLIVPIPVAARSKAWVCGRSLAGITGSNPAGAWMSVVSVVSCHVEGLITRQKKSLPTVVCLSVIVSVPTDCGLSEGGREASIMTRSLTHQGLLRHGKKTPESCVVCEVETSPNHLGKHLEKLRRPKYWIYLSQCRPLTLNAGITSLRARIPDENFYWEFCFLNRAFR